MTWRQAIAWASFDDQEALTMTIEPSEVDDLTDPDFLKWVTQHHGSPVEPDGPNFDRAAQPRTEKEQGHQYRLAQARKLMRLWGDWKATTNCASELHPLAGPSDPN
jgi:hypothetical protein